MITSDAAALGFPINTHSSLHDTCLTCHLLVFRVATQTILTSIASQSLYVISHLHKLGFLVCLVIYKARSMHLYPPLNGRLCSQAFLLTLVVATT